ncbi:MAG: hypothetical protein WCT23_00475 [Candidatus Neomarinimicrobiota bacterium]
MTVLSTQAATRYKWITVGSLQNFYYDTGIETEEIVYERQQWGFCWDAFHRDQDMQAAKGMWIGVKNFVDPVKGVTYPYKVIHNGPRAVTDVEMREFMPQEIKMIARYPHPQVFVDANEGSDMMNGADAKNDDISEVDPTLVADRVIENTVNTSVGLSFTKKVYAVAQQNYDNIHIIEYEFENTGIYDVDGNVSLQTLEDVYFHWQYRDAICQEGTWNGTYLANSRNWIPTSVREVRWGYSMMNDVIGRNQSSPISVSPYVDRTGQDAKDPDNNWMRGYVSWVGLWSKFGYDNIGIPNVNSVVHHDFLPADDGRLGAAQYKGMVVVHADKSTTDPSDDLSQPSGSSFINSDDPSLFTAALDQYDAGLMTAKYKKHMEGGHRTNHAEDVWNASDGKAGDYSASNDASGFSQMLAFGPYTIAPGEKIKIVFAECAAGLPHDYGYKVGQDWYKVVYENKTVEVVDPANPKSTITIKDVAEANAWKNAMVYSGRDSLMNSFRRAIELYRADFYTGIPEAPKPPETVEIFSTEDGVKLTWSGEAAVSSPHFAGFKVYRAFIEKDSTYHEVVDINILGDNYDSYKTNAAGTEFEYMDTAPLRGQNYYYYIVSYDDGTQNTVNPGVPLQSSLFFTRTNRSATVKSPPAPIETFDISQYDLNDPADRKLLMKEIIKIVPNPINVRNEAIQFQGNVNKLLFAGVPSGCKIRVFSERGDFVAEVNEAEEGYAWYLTTDWQQILVSGVYIAHFEMFEDFESEKTGVRLDRGDSIIKKFIIIR